MFRPDMPLQNLNVLCPTNLSNQLAKFAPDVTAEHRLAILRDEHEMVVQTIHGMGRSAVLAHRRASYRKPPEGVA
jgi:hypothetical protein